MTRVDLKTEDGLRAACAEVRSRIDQEQVREVAALVQEIRDAPQASRADLDFQIRVWSDLSLWRGGLMMRRRLDPRTFLEEDGLHEWFAEQTTRSLPESTDRRVVALTELYNALIKRAQGGPYGGQPRVETLRTLALFFPQDFTALADPAKIVPLARSMDFSVNDDDPVRANRLVLDRLLEVVGRPADGLEGTVERMLLPCELYRLEHPHGHLWVVRAGKDGEDEEYVLENGMAMLGFIHQPPPEARTYDEYLERSAQDDSSATKQVWNFAWELRKSDIVVLPRKKGGPVAWGIVEGAYWQREVEGEPRHTRRVKWMRTDIPRGEFGDDEKYLNQPRTVFSLQEHANRLLPILGVPGTAGTTLHPLPAAQRCRTLLTGAGPHGFETVKEVLALVGDGADYKDLVQHLATDERKQKPENAKTYLSAMRSAFGVIEQHEETVRATEIGRELQRTGNPDALRVRLLTENLGYDHLLVWLDGASREKKWLLGELQEVNPGWTTDASPRGLLRWAESLDLATEDSKGVFRITERGRDWRSRIHWEPERLETSARWSFEAVWTPLSESAGKDNLQFDRSLVEAMHLGLWADEQRHFAVLSGLSGTGKTQIALRYAMALTGAESDTGGPVEVISVHPGWHDPGPLLGYVNPLTGNYTCTEFLNFLLDAADDPDQPHVLILDEMNLSHPEQYFAPILSAMEIRDGEIPLHREDAEKLGVPTGVPYPSNLVIIGTVNMDETTMGISDKVLDRAFTLEFWDIEPEEWPGWDGCSLGEAEKSKVRGLLVELTKALSPARRHFGWRVIKEVVGFLEGRSRDSGIALTAEDALDQVIYAKVLPKLRGSDTGRFRDCLDATLTVLGKHHLGRCAEKVKALKEDLEATGSCSFWR